MTDTTPRSGRAYLPGEAAPLRSPHGGSWVLFGGIMVFLAGGLNVIFGVAAIGDSRIFTGNATYILSNLNTWGWIMLLLGVVQLLAAYSIWRGGEIGRWFGIAVAVANAIGALLSVSAYPFWSVAVFTLDILVIYALATYGGDPRLTT